MKQKLINLYKSVITSDKNIIEKGELDINKTDVFDNKSREIVDGSLKIQSKTFIDVGRRSEPYYNRVIYRRGSYSQHIYYKEDICKFYKGNLVNHTEEVDCSLDRVSISFHGIAPNLVLYPIRNKKEIKKDIISLRRRKYSIFSTGFIYKEYDINIKYYLKFGSIFEELNEKEYRDLISYATENEEKSNTRIVDVLEKFYK